MSDLYSELLVKRERTIKDSIIKYGLIVLTVIAVIASLISTPLIWIAAIALGIYSWYTANGANLIRLLRCWGIDF